MLGKVDPALYKSVSLDMERDSFAEDFMGKIYLKVLHPLILRFLLNGY